MDRLFKARGNAPAGGVDISAIVDVMTGVNDQLKRQNAHLNSLPVDPEWQRSLFGPGQPLPSQPLDQPNDQGFATPREFQYPVQWNIPGRHVFRGHVSWELLKEAADQPLFRACIEIRKQRISTLDWSFRVSPKYVARMARQSGKPEYQVENNLRGEYQDEIDRLTAFWAIPDRKNGYEFSD